MKTFLNAIGFLTIFKINPKFYIKKEQFWKISYYFPFTGIVIGLLMILFYFSVSFIFPVFVCIILTLGLEVLITGAMHLDGFSDTIDGIFCGEKDKNRIHEVMKKSDIGVFGVIALIFLFALKFAFFYMLITYGNGNKDSYGILLFICFMPAFGRWTINYNFKKFGSLSRQISLVKSFINNGNKKAFLVSSFYLFYLFICSALLSGFFFKGSYIFNFSGLSLKIFKAFNFDLNLILILTPLIKSIIIIIIIYFFTYLTGKFFTKKTGALSGDTIGALVEITEVLYLFFGFIIIKFV
jgi:adenosylcobinamide-GDP ribazoletransferase